MSKPATVSIGLPVYNGERYVAEAIKSILAQDFKDFELIISDNGSMDATRAICESFARHDSRVRYFRYEENRGAAWNFNNTVALSSAGYFKWQCYDDLLEPDMIARCLRVLEEEKEVVVCCTRTRIIDKDGNTRSLWEDGVDLREATPHERLRHLLFERNTAHLMSQFGLLRKSALQATRMMGAVPFSETILMAELAIQGQFRELPTYSFIMRHHPASSTSMYYHNLRALGIFLDPRRRGRRIWLTFERFNEHLRAVHTSRLPRAEAMRCYAIVLRFIARQSLSKGYRLLRSLGRDGFRRA